jgi:hypothetical protein
MYSNYYHLPTQGSKLHSLVDFLLLVTAQLSIKLSFPLPEVDVANLITPSVVLADEP